MATVPGCLFTADVDLQCPPGLREHSSRETNGYTPRSTLAFIAPGAQKEGPALPAVGSGLCLKIREIDTVPLHPHPDRDLRNQSEDHKCAEAKQCGDEWAHRIIFPKSLKPGPRAAFAIVFPVLRN